MEKGKNLFQNYNIYNKIFYVYYKPELKKNKSDSFFFIYMLFLHALGYLIFFFFKQKWHHKFNNI